MRRLLCFVPTLLVAVSMLTAATVGLNAQYRVPYPPYPYGGYRLAAPEADLRFDVTPKEAEVYVDGYFAGTVDDFDGVFQRLHVTPGEHEIVVYLKGHRPLRERLYLSVNTTRKIEGELERLAAGEAEEPPPVPVGPAPDPRDPVDPRRLPPRRGAPPPRPVDPAPARAGSLVIRVQPADADVLVDGQPWRGPARDERLVVQVSEGRHRIEVYKEGFVRFVDEVAVRPGESVPVNVSLTPERPD